MVLTLRDASFAYRGAAELALRRISLEVPRGGSLAVLGASGSGTSTLCRLIAGLLHDRGETSCEVDLTGSVIMLGDDPEAQLSGMASIVADEAQLPARLHGYEPEEARSRALAALELLGIEDLEERRLPTLSGGQRQLVALAGALAAGPDVLVLDQPSLSLDPSARRRLATALQAHCAGGGAVVLTGHQLDELALACDAVRFLDGGALAEEIATDTSRSAATGPSPTLLARHGVWDARLSRMGSPAVPPAAIPHAAVPPALRLDRLVVSRAGVPVLSGVDLEVSAGEHLALMGPNGVGKSTLLRALAGLLGSGASCSGAIIVHRDGEQKHLEALPAHRRAAHLGWVGQDPGIQLAGASIRSELLRAAPLPRHRRRQRRATLRDRGELVERTIGEAGLDDLAAMHPLDLELARRKDLVIASALLTTPGILLLDEPTLGRDAAAMTRLDGIIQRFLDRGGAVLSTTHDERWAAGSAHRVVRLG